MFILWPSKDGENHLLYLLGVDYDTSRVRCDTIENINPLYVKVLQSVVVQTLLTNLLAYWILGL